MFVFGLSGQTNQSHLTELPHYRAYSFQASTRTTHIVFTRPPNRPPEVFDQTSRTASSPATKHRLPAYSGTSHQDRCSDSLPLPFGGAIVQLAYRLIGDEITLCSPRPHSAGQSPTRLTATVRYEDRR